MTGSSGKARRARPLLGTLVEIVIEGREESVLQHAASGAFAAIERVHRLMSFHCEHSDVSTLNREAARREVAVHPETWRVLQIAAEVSAASGGIFDITIGGRMMRRGPSPGDGHPPADAQASFEDVELLGGNRVRFRCPLAIDLGGIAKGHAVDLAVEALAQVDGVSGWVNAGGDLRAFGGAEVPVRVRHPWRPQQMAAEVRLCDQALATTARYPASAFEASGAVIDPRGGGGDDGIRSASVCAPRCVLADALAKVAFLSRRRAAEILPQFGSRGFLLDRNGLEPLPASAQVSAGSGSRR